MPRALALLQLTKGASAPQISNVIPFTPQAIRKIGHRYQLSGLERAIYKKERPGAAEILDEGQKQRIIAIVCSDPPEGRARWTVRLVVEEAVKRRLVPRVGRETIRILLLHHDLKPWLSSRIRMVSRPILGTNFRLIDSSAISRTVHRAQPSGGSLHAMAIIPL